jgi:hypothetical protein
MIVSVLSAAALVAMQPAEAAAENEDAAVLDSLAWMEGCWSGPGFEGEMSECWMRTASGELVGAFQYSAHGELQFSEMLMIGTAGGRFGYHVKHFNRDFTGWETQNEQVTFPFEAADGGRMEFGGLVLERDGDDAFRAYLDMRGSDGTVRTVEFHFQRDR